MRAAHEVCAAGAAGRPARSSPASVLRSSDTSAQAPFPAQRNLLARGRANGRSEESVFSKDDRPARLPTGGRKAGSGKPEAHLAEAGHPLAEAGLMARLKQVNLQRPTGHMVVRLRHLTLLPILHGAIGHNLVRSLTLPAACPAADGHGARC